MKQLNNFIQEKLKVNSKTKINQYNFSPETRNELKDLVDKLIKDRGNNADLNDINTSKITDMYSLFAHYSFNGNISEWDVSNVKDMRGMFYNSQFNGNLSKWNVSNVEKMGGMFKDCPLEKNPPKWYRK